MDFERGKTWGVSYMVDVLLIGVRGFDGGWKKLSEFKIVGNVRVSVIAVKSHCPNSAILRSCEFAPLVYNLGAPPLSSPELDAGLNPKTVDEVEKER